jgi:guanylate kinase
MTTRAPRRGEREGEDYLFVTREVFEHRIAAGEMLEFAEVHGELYGTPRSNLDEARATGVHLLLDIDVQGARQVRRSVSDVVSIFVLPPSGERVIARLRSRASETEVELRARLGNAVAELEAVAEFDYVVVNDDLEAAIDTVVAIIATEERAVRQLGDGAVARATELQGEIRRALE